MQTCPFSGCIESAESPEGAVRFECGCVMSDPIDEFESVDFTRSHNCEALVEGRGVRARKGHFRQDFGGRPRRPHISKY